MDGDIAKECNKKHDANHVEGHVNTVEHAATLIVGRRTRVEVFDIFHSCIVFGVSFVHDANLHTSWAKIEHIKSKKTKPLLNSKK